METHYDLDALMVMCHYYVKSHMDDTVILRFENVSYAASFVTMTEIATNATFWTNHDIMTFTQPITVVITNYTRYFKEITS